MKKSLLLLTTTLSFSLLTACIGDFSTDPETKKANETNDQKIEINPAAEDATSKAEPIITSKIEPTEDFTSKAEPTSPDAIEDTVIPKEDNEKDKPLDMTPHVAVKTSMGSIVIELDRQKAPKTVENFLNYVDSGFYTKTVFHRVIKDFMIQGGGFSNGAFAEKPTKSPIVNEANNRLQNNEYTIAMARTSAPNSATSQFFINTKDNAFLNYQAGPDGTVKNAGYAVFGKVIKGKDIVDKIETVKTVTYSGMANFPAEPVVIQSITVIKKK